MLEVIQNKDSRHRVREGVAAKTFLLGHAIPQTRRSTIPELPNPSFSKNLTWQASVQTEVADPLLMTCGQTQSLETVTATV